MSAGRLVRAALRGLVVATLGLTLIACGLHIVNSGRDGLPIRPEKAVRVATYNVHYIAMRDPSGPWSPAGWERRKQPMQDAFMAMTADIVAFQEMESFTGGDSDAANLTREWLLANNRDYAAAAVGDWREFPSTQPIFYRKERFRVVDQGWFFFSHTPDVIYSRTFNGSWPAFASWAEFAPVNGGMAFHVFNLHFEYKSRSNRLQSAALVRDRIAPVVTKGGVVFLLGDVNATRGSTTVSLLEEAGLTFDKVEGSTYHLNRGVNLFGAIDLIAVAGPAKPAGPPVVLRRKFNGIWPSDHYPVLQDFQLEP